MRIRFLALFFALQLVSSYQYVGDKCPDDELGVCELFSKCEVAKRQYFDHHSHSLKRCGFSGREEIVCCPKPTDRGGEGDTGISDPRIEKRIADRECEKIKKQYTPALANYIISGSAAQLGEFPHMAALGFEVGNGGLYRFDCGGSLISDRYVLTAGHCVRIRDRDPPNIVRMGVVELCRNGAEECEFNATTDVRVAEVIPHPNYTLTFKYNDIALLRLESPVNYSEVLAPVCLYSGSEAPGPRLIATGFGQFNTTSSKKSNFLLQANLTYVPPAECRSSLPRRGQHPRMPLGLVDTQLCAVDPVRDTCQGDSGGPLVVVGQDSYFRLAGVTSNGGSCGSGRPALYTAVGKYLNWIVRQVWPSDDDGDVFRADLDDSF